MTAHPCDKPTIAAQQVSAGLSLLCDSRLVSWNPVERYLVAVPYDDVKGTWLHQHARLEAWVLFGVGAEYLVKGACLARGQGRCVPKGDYIDLGTLRDYKSDVAAILPGEANSFTKLTTLRNRDVHSYMPGERGKAKDHPIIAEEFVPLLNSFLKSLPPDSPSFEEVDGWSLEDRAVLTD